MTIATDIHADLITPLGAYLRLRRAGEPSFPKGVLTAETMTEPLTRPA